MTGSLRVATFNLHHGVGADGRFDRPRMVAACRSLGADVLALQEVDRRSLRTRWTDEPALIGQATGLHAEFVTTRNWGPIGRYGLALLTRWDPTRVDVVELAGGDRPKQAIVAEVAVPIGGGEPLVMNVVATHLKNDAAVASAQLDALLDALDGADLGGPDRPVLLAGDLNCGPDVVIPRLTEAGFVAVDAPATFPARDPQQRIDWIAGRHLTFNDESVPRLDASDHLPLVATAHWALRPM